MVFALAYTRAQQPGDLVSDNQIIRRLEILKPCTSSIRTFSSLNEHARIVETKDMGFKTLVGAWLSDDIDSNDEEVEGLIELANNGLVDVAAVGNEVIYRKELEESQLISYINYVKERLITSVAVEYYEFRDRPNITDACDVILANCYPFGEGCTAEYSLL